MTGTCEHCRHWQRYRDGLGHCSRTLTVVGKALDPDSRAVAIADGHGYLGHAALVTNQSFGCNQFAERAQP